MTLLRGLTLLCGVGALVLIIVFIALRVYLASQSKKIVKKVRREKQVDRELSHNTQTNIPSESRSETLSTLPAPVRRDPEVLRREQEVLRDSLHIFRQLKACKDKETRSRLCLEASDLFDDLPNRVGRSAAATTSGQIVFCNGLMECNGLDELQDCKDGAAEK
eukprot:CAMPEP_0194518284 /NCGR_PEP_ID=MMETSP0253-20130528/51655_1 /TAXON_ID=2966 /ORGANISM="Noctiluca scintillans" /LENGTH=162 /DNA_ID=CAMNT_0039362317 /DNA_START=60 /DNA_END=545 /DNA_ORIENTATION=-